MSVVVSDKEKKNRYRLEFDNQSISREIAELQMYGIKVEDDSPSLWKLMAEHPDLFREIKNAYDIISYSFTDPRVVLKMSAESFDKYAILTVQVRKYDADFISKLDAVMPANRNLIVTSDFRSA